LFQSDRHELLLEMKADGACRLRKQELRVWRFLSAHTCFIGLEGAILELVFRPYILRKP
jgi:hypothetical protein